MLRGQDCPSPAPAMPRAERQRPACEPADQALMAAAACLAVQQILPARSQAGWGLLCCQALMLRGSQQPSGVLVTGESTLR